MGSGDGYAKDLKIGSRSCMNITMASATIDMQVGSPYHNLPITCTMQYAALFHGYIYNNFQILPFA